MGGFSNISNGLGTVLNANNASFDGTIQGGILSTNGQLWIGSTALNVGNTNVNVGTITSPLGTITVGYSSPNITLDVALGGMVWTDVTTATQALSVENGYFTDRGGGVTYTLPATAVLGAIIKIDGKLGITTVAQNAGQQIRFSSSLTTVGVIGSIVGTNVGDCVTLRCSTAGASTVWVVENSTGNWTIN